jgi:hypothetical protein
MKSGATILTAALLASVVSAGCGNSGADPGAGAPLRGEIVATAPSADELCDIAGLPGDVSTPGLAAPEPPCRLVAVHVATLSPSPSGEYPDPGRGRILYHDRGIITNVAAHMGDAWGSLLLWGPDGSFREVIGGPGEGPGEFTSNFRLEAHAGPDRQVFVNEQYRWTVLDSTLAFVRIVSSPLTGSYGNHLVVTGDGGYVRAGRAPATDDDSWFHYFDRDGQLVRSFGSRVSDGVAREFGWRELVPGSTDETFWASPPGGAPDAYVLEEWSVTGELVSRIERTVTWDDAVLPATVGFGGVPNFQLHDDGQGLLWVLSGALREGVDPAEAEAALDVAAEEMSRLTDLLLYRLEVINPETAEVVAAAEFDVPTSEGAGLPTVPVFGARMGARYVLDENGFRSIELFDWYLVRP